MQVVSNSHRTKNLVLFFVDYSSHTDSLQKCCRYCAVTITPAPLISPRQSSTAGADPVSCCICEEAIGKLSCARAFLHGPMWRVEGVLAQVVHKKKETSTSRDECQATWTYFPWETRKPWKCIYEAEKQMTMWQSAIADVCRGKLLQLSSWVFDDKSRPWLHSRLRSQNKLWL